MTNIRLMWAVGSTIAGLFLLGCVASIGLTTALWYAKPSTESETQSLYRECLLQHNNPTDCADGALRVSG